LQIKGVSDFAVSVSAGELGSRIFTSLEFALILASFVVTDVIAASSEIERSSACTTLAICLIEPLKFIGSDVIATVVVSLELTGVTGVGVGLDAELDETAVVVSVVPELLTVEVSEVRTVDVSLEIVGSTST
jgi:hypothetical protein